MKSRLNFVVADTKVWEQAAAYAIDTHPGVAAFAKNAGLGFAVPYLHNGQPHEYLPDFVIRLAGEPDRYLVLETKGFDELTDIIKAQAADRWVKAVNADGRFGRWRYAMVRKPGEVAAILSRMG
jgi:type III restriction enzyme